MGRRSIHTPEELRELILQAATDIVSQNGLEGLSARELAKRIGYSPGTLYNVFDNLDDLLLTIEARLLDDLAERLAQADTSGTPKERVQKLAETYYAFTQECPNLWNLLQQHRLPADYPIPEWYKSKLESLLVPIQAALEPMLANADANCKRRAARTFWATLHGVTSLSTTNKLSPITGSEHGVLVNELVDIYLAGMGKLHPATVGTKAPAR